MSQANQSFEQQYYDPLRAIELAITTIYRQKGELVDYNVEKALDGLVRHYTAQIRGKNAPKLRLNALESSVFEQVRMACDVHMGRDEAVPIEQPLTLDETLACLKRIQRSVGQMRNQGRQAYLEFVDSFFSDS